MVFDSHAAPEVRVADVGAEGGGQFPFEGRSVSEDRERGVEDSVATSIIGRHDAVILKASARTQQDRRVSSRSRRLAEPVVTKTSSCSIASRTLRPIWMGVGSPLHISS